MTTARKVLLALGIFGVTISCLVGLALFVIMVVFGGPHLASYLAGLFGLGALAEVIITGFLFMVIPAGVITYVKFND